MELFKLNDSDLVVIVCAFYGARARVRQKYAELWVNKGASVIALSNGIPHPESSAIEGESRRELRERCKAALDTLIANGLDRQRVVFHISSEGGMSTWLQMMQLLEAHSNVRGCLRRAIAY